ncbi:hypothetical protein Desor_5294 [Desulfosporosinus orientis DSM 765]|uniref:Uncharacterized protein n=1 Tax=Desulfosporosinus orientis (strain ATCC 19365 / DSM 765 / NCIMB 8382 / VKM B-1628 / Singapore I) TaxID=768706 RepID=G7WC56_DESOD|nr:hypothetical protein [Desulfosporosinus orientis]AET70674.1 hypothetical protein Desor_5294 [Desulfosporosinus orientis DSM 765]
MPFRRRGSLPPSDTCPTPIAESAAIETEIYKFNRLIPLLEYPTVGAGILSIILFFFVAFLSDLILARITSMTLGIVVTISTLALIAIIILILIML